MSLNTQTLIQLNPFRSIFRDRFRFVWFQFFHLLGCYAAFIGS